MSLAETIVEGTIQPDGSLVLDQKPSLPPGRVRVVVQAEDWWSYLQRYRREVDQAGAPFRSARQIEFEVEQIRGETERWIAWGKVDPPKNFRNS